MQLNTAGWPSWAWTGGGVLLSVTFALLGHTLLYRVLWRIARRSATPVDDALLRHTCAPTRVLLPLIAFSASLDTLGLDTHRVDVDALRAELDRIVRGTDLWDGRVAALQVTDATEQAIQLRALVSPVTPASHGTCAAWCASG